MKEDFLNWIARKFGKLIMNLYARTETQDKKAFVINAYELESKNGTKKTLLFVHTKQGKYKFWLKNGQIDININPAFIHEK